MLDAIKEDIEQIKLDQQGLKEDTDSCTGKQLKKQITNKEASRLYAELLLCVCWHTEHI